LVAPNGVHTRWREAVATRDSKHLAIKSGVVLGGALFEKLDRAGAACKIENELDDCSPTKPAQFAQTGGQSIAPRVFLAVLRERRIRRTEYFPLRLLRVEAIW
jgi:hypothetical protein